MDPITITGVSLVVALLCVSHWLGQHEESDCSPVTWETHGARELCFGPDRELFGHVTQHDGKWYAYVSLPMVSRYQCYSREQAIRLVEDEAANYFEGTNE